MAVVTHSFRKISANMRAPKFSLLAIAACVLLFSCFDALADTNQLQLPPELKMNKDAGRGKLLIVKVGLENGEKLAVFLDTGTGRTCFDKSVEPKLGKRLAESKISHWGKSEEAGVYAAPKLFLGDVPLIAPAKVFTTDLSRFSGQGERIMGILGWDCLSNYCIQLDFTDGKIRFLNSADEDKSGWGKSFPIIPRSTEDPRPTIPANLVGVKGPRSMLDSGCTYDGWLAPALYRQWTNTADLPKDGEVRSHKGILGGETYSDVRLRKHPQKDVPDDDVERNGIGLSFMARHLVTFDFPHQMLYLKPTTTGRLLGEEMEKFVQMFKKDVERARLPGMPNVSDYDYTVETTKNSATINVHPQYNQCTYHYEFAHPAGKKAWRLKKAWRTDAENHVKEYPVLEAGDN